MDADSHARRSPAVRARHFRKRLPIGPLAEDDAGSPLDSSDTSLPTDSSGDPTTDPAFLPLHTAVSTDDSQSTTDSGDSSITSDAPTSTASDASTTAASSTPVISFPTSAPTTTGSSSSTVPATATPSSSNAASNSSASSGSSKGMSGGAIAAIVTVLVIALIAVALFFVRKKYIKNRQMKRATWNAGAFAKRNELGSTAGEAEKAGGDNEAGFMPGAGNRASYGATQQQQQVEFVPPAPVTPPAMSYNNPPNASLPPSLSPGLSSAAPAVGMERSSAAPTASDALIKCTFIPSLPDELSITTGETVRVVAEYDDGWAMCANARGEQGMVPLECLDQSMRRGSVGGVTPNGSGFPSQGDWRGSKRVSSLSPARY